MPRPATNVDPNETKADKFKRLATGRVNNALSALEGLEALSNKSAYEYTPEQLETIFNTLNAKLETVANSFKNGGPAKKGGFSL